MHEVRYECITILYPLLSVTEAARLILKLLMLFQCARSIVLLRSLCEEPRSGTRLNSVFPERLNLEISKIRMNRNFHGEHVSYSSQLDKLWINVSLYLFFLKYYTHLYTGLLSLYHTTSSKLSLRIGGLESQANSASPPTTAATRVTVPVTVDNGLPAKTMGVHIDKGIEN